MLIRAQKASRCDALSLFRYDAGGIFRPGPRWRRAVIAGYFVGAEDRELILMKYRIT